MPDTVLDIFRNDAFTVASLRTMVDDVPYVPQALGAMGLFEDDPITTIGIEIYLNRQTQTLIPTTVRGAPEPLPTRDNSEIRYLRTTRLAKRDRINSHEVQDIVNAVMAGNNNIALRRAADEVVRRMQKLKNEMELTKEYHRLGALQGLLLDADGTTVIRNYFTEFGVTAPVDITVDFANIAEEDILTYFQDTFLRPMLRVLKDRKTPGTRIMAMVGDTFWSKLTRHPGVRKTYIYSQDGARLREANAWQSFEFAGITWWNYMGTDDGTTIAIPSNGARFFPVGARDVFKVYWSPGESWDDVNTLGRPSYPVIQPDPETQKNEWVDILLRCYPLYACLFPAALMKAHSA